MSRLCRTDVSQVTFTCYHAKLPNYQDTRTSRRVKEPRARLERVALFRSAGGQGVVRGGLARDGPGAHALPGAARPSRYPRAGHRLLCANHPQRGDDGRAPSPTGPHRASLIAAACQRQLDHISGNASLGRQGNRPLLTLPAGSPGGSGYFGGRAAMGIRRPKPKAREVTFRPGAACWRLYSLTRILWSTSSTVRSSSPSRMTSSRVSNCSS